jgi:Tfp pilus assembly protein PilZ
MAANGVVDTHYVKTRLMALIDNLSDDSLLELLRAAEALPLKGNRKELRKICLTRLSLLTQNTRFQGTAHDISYSGIFVETGIPVRLGADISLLFSAAGVNDAVEIKGEVKRICPGGIGVQFKNLTPEQEGLIRQLVDSI